VRIVLNIILFQLLLFFIIYCVVAIIEKYYLIFYATIMASNDVCYIIELILCGCYAWRIGQRPPVVNLDAIPREITVKAGRRVDLEIPFTGECFFVGEFRSEST